jgi:hypothetical protein
MTKSEITFDLNGNELVVEYNHISDIKSIFLENIKELSLNESFYEKYSTNQDNNLDSTISHDLFLKAIEMGVKDFDQYTDNEKKTTRLKNVIFSNLSSLYDEKGWFGENDDELYDEAERIFNISNHYSIFTEAVVEAVKETLDKHNILHHDVFNNDDDFENEIKDSVFDGLIEQDTSSIEDVLNHLGNIPSVYIPLNDNEYMIDEMIECDGNTGSANNVIPDESFQKFLKMINMSPGEFIDGMKEKNNIDLKSKDESNRYEMWNELLTLNKNDFKNKNNKTPSLTIDQVIEIIDNTNGYGSPSIVFNAKADLYLEMAEKKNILLSVKNGGQIGLLDRVNGSGHLINNDNETIININLNSLKPDEGSMSHNGYGVDEIFGFTKKAFEADITIIKEPEYNKLSNKRRHRI